MSEANDPYEVEEQFTQEHEVVAEPESEAETGGELFKFGILAIVLLFTVLIIALLRPLIFNRIVPAVLGEGQLVAPLVTGTEAETIKPEATEEGVEAVEETNEGNVGAEEETTPNSTETPPEPENPEDFPTAVPAQNHTVQAGETLTAISQRYGVTVQAIVAANNIPNPDRVAVGTVLIIPVGQ
jgi:nucleoid-associated protein YgaU